MLAYRHAFHAGNHGDVLKHLVLMAVLAHMNLKDKGWRYVDTHAGAGGYALGGNYARKRSEFSSGIGRLWDREDLPPDVAEYVELVRSLNRGGPALAQYPGSPLIAQAFMRPQDQLRLFELHPTDHRILVSAFAGDRGVEVHLADGFEALKSQLPPPTRRAVVLVDPAYEGERDYARLPAALRDALRRFAEGTYIIWYPQVGKIGARELPRRLLALAPKAWLHARLTVARADAQGFGMVGSGVIVINPPFTLHDRLQALLPWLAQALAQTDEPSWLLDHKSV
jgi:23S rRNA (adenine2030-N6)-methyltransferase